MGGGSVNHTSNKRAEITINEVEQIVAALVKTKDKSKEKTKVCIHWFRGACQKGDQCGYLHRFDPEKMPVCTFFIKFGQCDQ